MTNKPKEELAIATEGEMSSDLPDMQVTGSVLDAYVEHMKKAEQAVEDKDLVRAVFEFEAALLLRPNMSQPYLMLGQIMKQNGKMMEALRNYEKAYELRPKNTFVLVNIAEIMFELGDNESAKGIACDAIAIDEGCAPAICLLASVLGLEGDVDQAIELLQCAIEEQPEEASFWHVLAQLCRRQGDFANADIFFQEAMRFNPASKSIQADYAEMKAEMSPETLN